MHIASTPVYGTWKETREPRKITQRQGECAKLNTDSNLSTGSNVAQPCHHEFSLTYGLFLIDRNASFYTQTCQSWGPLFWQLQVAFLRSEKNREWNIKSLQPTQGNVCVWRRSWSGALKKAKREIVKKKMW